MRTLATAWAASWIVALVAPARAQAPELAVSKGDGSLLVGEVVRAGDGVLVLRTEGQVVELPLSDLIALHGGEPREGAAVTACLVGGDEVRGELRGGDPAGETLVVESRSLGNVSVPIDRLQAFVVHKVAPEAAASEFTLPVEGEHDEALFLPARRGFDTVFGAIHRFTADGVLFAPASAGVPRAYALDKVAAVALRGGKGPARKTNALLVTRAGDVVSVDFTGGDATSVEVTDDRSRKITLPWSDVATLLLCGDDRLFLSELQPEAVEESSALTGESEPLFPWRRDRNVRGGFLVVGGRTYARGLGVHSRCVLTFKVPEGYQSLCLAVGIDDEVRSLPARGDVDIAVLVDGQVVAERARVRVGAPAVSLGSLPVRGGCSLSLRVEVGAGLDLGDRVDWLHAVLLRKRPQRSGRRLGRRRLRAVP